MKKPVSAWIEFSLVLLLIIAAVVFVLNINVGSINTTPLKKADESKMAAASNNPAMANWEEGRATFKANCGACHNPKWDGTGPALNGVIGRWKAAGTYQGKTGEQWLHAWIKNWNVPVEAGYKYAVNMANSRVAQMNIFTNLSDAQIDKILLYINSPDTPVAQ